MNLSKEVREAFGMSQSELAHCLNVRLYTVTRWEEGNSSPFGTSATVLQGLHFASQKLDAQQTAVWAGHLKLGLGGFIHYVLTK